MPFCEECAKYWAPSAMKADGSCPSCGRVLGAPEPPPSAATGEPGERLTGRQLREMAGEDAKVPWHFKLLVVGVVVYLGWRLVQLVGLIF